MSRCRRSDASSARVDPADGGRERVHAGTCLFRSLSGRPRRQSTAANFLYSLSGRASRSPRPSSRHIQQHQPVDRGQVPVRHRRGLLFPTTPSIVLGAVQREGTDEGDRAVVGHRRRFRGPGSADGGCSSAVSGAASPSRSPLTQIVVLGLFVLPNTPADAGKGGQPRRRCLSPHRRRPRWYCAAEVPSKLGQRRSAHGDIDRRVRASSLRQ